VVLSHGSPVLSLAVLPDARLASGGNDDTIKLWPKEGKGDPVVLSHGDAVKSLAVLTDGRLTSGGGDGKIKLWPKEGKGEPVVMSHGSTDLSLAAKTVRSSCGAGRVRASRRSSRTAARSGL
jgi:WD40 repeat protein